MGEFLAAAGLVTIVSYFMLLGLVLLVYAAFGGVLCLYVATFYTDVINTIFPGGVLISEYTCEDKVFVVGIFMAIFLFVISLISISSKVMMFGFCFSTLFTIFCQSNNIGINLLFSIMGLVIGVLIGVFFGKLYDEQEMARSDRKKTVNYILGVVPTGIIGFFAFLSNYSWAIYHHIRKEVGEALTENLYFYQRTEVASDSVLQLINKGFAYAILFGIFCSLCAICIVIVHLREQHGNEGWLTKVRRIREHTHKIDLRPR